MIDDRRFRRNKEMYDNKHIPLRVLLADIIFFLLYYSTVSDTIKIIKLITHS